MSDNDHRWSEDSSCHHMGCSCTLLYDQHWQTSEVSDFFRSTEEMGVSTFRPVGKVDINSRAKTQGPATTTHGPTMAGSNKCGVDIKAPEAPENHNDLVRSVANRKQECQKTINKYLTGSRFKEPSSLSSGQSWEFGKESSALSVRELCRNEHIVPSSVTDTRATNQNSCNRNSDTKNDITLLELQNDMNRKWVEKRSNKKRKRIKRSIDMKIIPVCLISTLILQLNPIYSCIVSYHLYCMICFIGNLYKSNVQEVFEK